MTDQELQKVLEALDNAVLEEGARVLIPWTDPEEGGVEIVANRAGYLRLGIEMMKVALAPLPPNTLFVPATLDNLIDSKRGTTIRRLERREDVEAALPPPRKKTWKDYAAVAGCLCVVVFFVICALIGLYSLLRLI